MKKFNYNYKYIKLFKKSIIKNLKNQKTSNLIKDLEKFNFNKIIKILLNFNSKKNENLNSKIEKIIKLYEKLYKKKLNISLRKFFYALLNIENLKSIKKINKLKFKYKKIIKLNNFIKNYVKKRKI